MAETRVEAIDERLKELGYPEAAFASYHEDLFCFSRNFAAEADRQQIEINRLKDVLSFYVAAIDPHQTEATADWELTDVRWRQRIDEMHQEIMRLQAEAKKRKVIDAAFADAVEQLKGEYDEKCKEAKRLREYEKWLKLGHETADGFLDIPSQSHIVDKVCIIGHERDELRDENKRLREELAEELDSAFRTAAHFCNDGTDWDGWWDSMASSTTTHLGDRLVELGLWERPPDGYGRRWFYRPIEKPEAAEASSKGGE